MSTTRDQDLPITNDDLHAYADGMLTPERAAAVEVYLAEHPTAARQVAEYKALNVALRSALEPVLVETAVPVDAVIPAQPRKRFAIQLAAAAAVAGLLVGGGAGWFSNAYFGGKGDNAQQIAERAAAAYSVYAPETRHPVEVGVEQADHLVAWLSNRMGMSFEIPQLDAIGFSLIGGRLMVGDAAPAALLMYENDQGRRMVLYIRNDLPQGKQTALHYRRNAGTGVIYWLDGDKGFGLSGGFSEQELSGAAKIVRAVYKL